MKDKPKNETYCECDKGPTCYVDAAGKNVIKICPAAYPGCLISKVGVTVAKTVVDQGNCFGGGGDYRYKTCLSGGPFWGPKEYANGTTGVPEVGNRCKYCTCVGGYTVNCKVIKGCTTP